MRADLSAMVRVHAHWLEHAGFPKKPTSTENTADGSISNI